MAGCRRPSAVKKKCKIEKKERAKKPVQDVRLVTCEDEFGRVGAVSADHV